MVDKADFTGSDTPDDPWVLYTPSLSSQFQMHRDESHDPPVLVCTVGNYVSPVLEALSLAEVEHNARVNGMRAL